MKEETPSDVLLPEPEKSEQPMPLRDIREIHLDPSQSREERMTSWLRQVGDPCHFRCGNLTVELCFQPAGPSLEDLLLSILELPEYETGRPG